ncbi:hypothetical protein NDI56_07215 [Haloarcula sp. S1CR25-12]|uniref:Uncharacterized protein n=1 Tax=Haloarcula saliterrae TaxID=2950534 RepID=A0ABU2FAB5_9EURY|nr:hypothetical protein [Haloarcula sp. S1CR25-12]MDS0259179.1 hypothetical protein [Haloarcula sp. S1CR25-12]
MIGDTRAVSPAVTQALTIGISTILITGLLLGGSSYIDTKRDNTVRQGLIDVGSGVASDLVRLDQFDTDGVSQEISFSSAYPDRVGGEGYRIHLDPSADRTTIYINSTASDRRTQVRFKNTTAVCESRVTGGPIQVVYDATEPCLEVRAA